MPKLTQKTIIKNQKPPRNQALLSKASKLDWANLTPAEARVKLKVSVMTEWRLRMTFAPHTINTFDKYLQKWQGVDWSKSKAEIADELGVSRQAVYDAEKRLKGLGLGGDDGDDHESTGGELPQAAGKVGGQG